MKPVKLSVGLLIGDKFHPKDATVALKDEMAARLIKEGHAAAADDGAEITNPDHNPHADFIDPVVGAGPVLNPADALAPNVADNPGLAGLVNSLKKVKTTKQTRVKPSDVVGPTNEPVTDAGLDPATTANEVTTEA